MVMRDGRRLGGMCRLIKQVPVFCCGRKFAYLGGIDLPGTVHGRARFKWRRFVLAAPMVRMAQRGHRPGHGVCRYAINGSGCEGGHRIHRRVWHRHRRRRVAGHDEFAGFPHAAWPAAAVLLLASVAVLTRRRRAVLAVAVVLLAGSCWLLLNLVDLALTGTVNDRHGDPAWPAFLERLGLTAAGALLVAAAVRRRTGGVRPPAHAAPARIRWIAYAGCVAWLPYGGVHLLSVLGVPGLEPDGFRPSPSMAVALCVGLGLAVFLLLGLVRPWGMVFPRWTILLAGRRAPLPADRPGLADRTHVRAVWAGCRGLRHAAGGRCAAVARPHRPRCGGLYRRGPADIFRWLRAGTYRLCGLVPAQDSTDAGDILPPTLERTHRSRAVVLHFDHIFPAADRM